MNDNAAKKNTVLGFLDFLQTPNKDGFLSALLLTDYQGIPQEFRCTRPVKPTAIQTPLYGDKLKPHIAVNLCGIPLVQSLKNEPTLILVQERSLLEIRPSTKCPVVYTCRAGEVIEIEPTEEAEGGAGGEWMESPTAKFQPIVWQTHPDYDEDKGIATEILREISEHLDPLEPFDRICTAIGVIGKQDERFT